MVGSFVFLILHCVITARMTITMMTITTRMTRVMTTMTITTKRSGDYENIEQ